MPFVKEIRKCNCSMKPSATEAYTFYEPGTTWRYNYCDAVYQLSLDMAGNPTWIQIRAAGTTRYL